MIHRTVPSFSYRRSELANPVTGCLSALKAGCTPDKRSSPLPAAFPVPLTGDDEVVG